MDMFQFRNVLPRSLCFLLEKKNPLLIFGPRQIVIGNNWRFLTIKVVGLFSCVDAFRSMFIWFSKNLNWHSIRSCKIALFTCANYNVVLVNNSRQNVCYIDQL